MGRNLLSTTKLLDEERDWWKHFHGALSRLDQLGADELWTHAFQVRAAVTAHNTPNITEPILVACAVDMQRRADEARAELRAKVLQVRDDWQAFQDLLPRDEQAAHRRLWSHALHRIDAVEAHRVHNLAEPVLYSMLLGVHQDVRRLEHAMEGLRVHPRRAA